MVITGHVKDNEIATNKNKCLNKKKRDCNKSYKEITHVGYNDEPIC